MENRFASRGASALISALALAALTAGTPDAGSAATAAMVQSTPCPSTIQVDGRTATLTVFMCGTLTANVGTPGPLSIGVTVGHCTGCECGYMWEGQAGGQFTRRSAGECGLGNPPGGSGGGDDDYLDEQEGACEWGEDYIGWEPRDCQ